MTKLTLTKPEVGQKNLTEEPKVGNALTAIEQWANGEIDTFNLKNEGIEEVDLSAAVKALLGAKVSGFTVTSHAGSVTGVGGELAVMEGNGTTYKLPTPTANTTVAVFCGTQPTSIKVQASGTKIYGDFITGIETITLAQLQHVTLIANGTVWLIVAGEPKREQLYSGFTAHTKVELEAGVEISASRPAMVSVRVEGAWAGAESISVGGKAAAIVAKAEAGSNLSTATVYVPPGQKVTVLRAAEISAILQ